VKEGEAAGGPGAAKGASYLDDVRRALLSVMAEGEGADEATVLEAYQALMQVGGGCSVPRESCH
jgi:hypothetical protein